MLLISPYCILILLNYRNGNLSSGPVDPHHQRSQRTLYHMQKELLDSIRQHLSELKTYGFAEPLRTEVDNMQTRYLYNSGILEDLMKTETYLKSSILKGSSQSISGGSENLEE